MPSGIDILVKKGILRPRPNNTSSMATPTQSESDVDTRITESGDTRITENDNTRILQ